MTLVPPEFYIAHPNTVVDFLPLLLVKFRSSNLSTLPLIHRTVMLFNRIPENWLSSLIPTNPTMLPVSDPNLQNAKRP